MFVMHNQSSLYVYMCIIIIMICNILHVQVYESAGLPACFVDGLCLGLALALAP